ncbi:MAG: SDR family oxidoreductase [Bacteroidales bacterium]|nr:SDR family oxidoreductase [Bacteroidales bacterium]
MDLDLKNRNVIVSAAANGIGKGVATSFARENARVILLDINEEDLKKAVEEIADLTGNKPDFFSCNLRNPEEIAKAVSYAEKLNGPVWALFNNSGGPPVGTFETLTDEKWQMAFELTLLNYVRMTRAVLPGMKKNGGRIVNHTSTSIKAAIDQLMLSNSLRTGIMGFTKSLAREYGKFGILANVIAPGRIDTERLAEVNKAQAEKAELSIEEYIRKNLENIPLGRYGKTEEIGNLALFLCSPLNTYITGQSVLVDGGMTAAY